MISLVISAMNRTQNLCSVLESWIDQSEFITDIVVIDWSSKDRLYDNAHIKNLINNKKINLIEVIDEKYFSLSKAYNLAYSKISKNNEYFLKLDADYVLLDNIFIDKIFDTNADKIFIRGENKSHYTGFFGIKKSNFIYYNENFNGWGYDDLDLYDRLKKNNLQEIVLTDIQKYIYHIPHSDKDSIASYSIKNKAMSEKNNRLLSNRPFIISKYETIYKTDCYEKVKRIC